MNDVNYYKKNTVILDVPELFLINFAPLFKTAINNEGTI